MKRIISALLTTACLFTLCSCAAADGSSATFSKIEKTSVLESSASSGESSAVSKKNEKSAIYFPDDMNLLTGQIGLSLDAQGKRPIAVMVNNAAASLPQYGISDADLVFEIPVEGETTRLMAMYGDYTKVPDICSVRSARYYYPTIAHGFDALYIHWGMDETVAKPLMAELGLDNIDGNYGTYGLFDRDQDKLNQGYNLEHTSVLYGSRLKNALEENNHRLALNKDYTKPAFTFNTKETPATGDTYENFKVSFGDDSSWAYFSNFSYNSTDKTYLKTHNENPHVDGRTEKQLAFTNVIVLETPIGHLPNDTSGRREIDMTGSKKSGYYISGGKMQKILWSKKDAADKLTFKDEKGKALKINTGKTYIAVCDQGGLSLAQ